MGLACTFTLNRQPVSPLVCPGVGSFAAFSDLGEGRSKPAMTNRAGIGPLPVGTDYIVDRQSGVGLGRLWDWQKRELGGTDHASWFALYRDDGTIDDRTTVDGVQRGDLRLHPTGPMGIGEGCITLIHAADFQRLHDASKAGMKAAISGGGVAYGTILVR